MQIRFLTSAAVAVTLGSLAACGGSSSPSSSSGSSSGFCQGAQQVNNQFSAIGNLLNGASPDPSTVAQVLQQSAQQLDSLDSQAPAQIATAFHHLRTAYDTAVQQVQGDTTIDQMQSPLAALGDSSLQADAQTVQNYMTNTCHITDQPSPAST